MRVYSGGFIPTIKATFVGAMGLLGQCPRFPWAGRGGGVNAPHFPPLAGESLRQRPGHEGPQAGRGRPAPPHHCLGLGGLGVLLCPGHWGLGPAKSSSSESPEPDPARRLHFDAHEPRATHSPTPLTASPIAGGVLATEQTYQARWAEKPSACPGPTGRRGATGGTGPHVHERSPGSRHPDNPGLMARRQHGLQSPPGTQAHTPCKAYVVGAT